MFNFQNVYKLFSWENCSIRKKNNWILDASMPKSESNETVLTFINEKKCRYMTTSYKELIETFINETDLLIQISSCYNIDTDLFRNNLRLALETPVITPEVYISKFNRKLKYEGG
jgi:hypothetical protein